MSLWLANDASTSSIMQNFYRYVAKGEGKHSALRKAKLHYLEHGSDPISAHPYFWANMVAVGDMAPLRKPSNYLYWITVLGVAVAFGIGLKWHKII